MRKPRRKNPPRTRLCECGCGMVIHWKYGRLRQFYDRSHIVRAKHQADMRLRRSKIAVAAAVASRLRKCEDRAAKYPTKGKAWSAGYRIGCNRRDRWWRAKYAAVYAQLMALRQGRAA